MTRYAFTSWVCVSSWQNVIQCKIIVVGTSMEAVLSSLPGVYMSACLSVDRFCQCKLLNMQLQHFTVCTQDLNVDWRFWRWPWSKRRGQKYPPIVYPWPTFMVLETLIVAGTTTGEVLGTLLGVHISVCLFFCGQILWTHSCVKCRHKTQHICSWKQSFKMGVISNNYK